MGDVKGKQGALGLFPSGSWTVRQESREIRWSWISILLSQPHQSYGATKAPSFLLQCSPSFSGNSSSAPFHSPDPPLQSGIAPVLFSCLMKAPVFWIYDARAGGRLSGDTPRCVPCNAPRAGAPGPENGQSLGLESPSPTRAPSAPGVDPRREAASPHSTDRRRPLVRAPRPPGARSPRRLTWHVDLPALLVRELAPVPLARGDAWLLHQKRAGHLQYLLARRGSLP